MRFAAFLAAFAALGLLGGWAHFTLLLGGVRSLMAGAPIRKAIAAGIARGAVTLATFATAASCGIFPLCAALAGFLAARTAFVRNAETLLS